MIVISGCPRSGTSLMMDCIRVVYGEDKIIGNQWPSEHAHEMRMRQQEGEDDNLYTLRTYLFHKQNPNFNLETQATRDMNPNGFWECPFTVGGIYYTFANRGLLRSLAEETGEGHSFCKIVSQGLFHSDPQYIAKIVYMLRGPRAVAKSQERLKRSIFKDANGEAIDLSQHFKIQTPEMFIQVTAMACQWLLSYPEVPVLIINFDDLLSDPSGTLGKVQEFIGYGDFTEAIRRINPKYNRSMPENVENELWEDADYVYEKFLEGDYQAVVEKVRDPESQTSRSRARWHCPRVGMTQTRKQCELCRTNSVVRKNFKKAAERLNADWLYEPCPYECGLSTLPSISMTESIRNNFWLHDNPVPIEGD